LSDEILAAGDYANATDVDRAIDENLRWSCGRQSWWR